MNEKKWIKAKVEWDKVEETASKLYGRDKATVVVPDAAPQEISVESVERMPHETVAPSRDDGSRNWDVMMNTPGWTGQTPDTQYVGTHDGLLRSAPRPPVHFEKPGFFSKKPGLFSKNPRLFQ